MKVFKKSLAVMLAILMLFSLTAVAFAAEDEAATWIVAGTGNLCGSEWSPADTSNALELGEDGLYSKTYEAVPVGEGYQFKVTNGTWDEAYGADGNNFTFNVVEECDVTITFNAETKEITVTGDGVVIPNELKVDYIVAVGDNKGDASFLNGISWNQAAEENKMATEDGKVFTITYKGVAAYAGYQVKFAANGAWTDNWGTADDAEEGVAVYNGDNIYFDVDYDLADVTLTLDLTNFDYSTKSGATYSIEVVEAKDDEATEDEATEETTEDVATGDEAPEETTEPAVTEVPEETEPSTPAETEPSTPEVTEPSETQPEETEPAPVPGFYLVGSEEVCGAEWGWNDPAPWTYSDPMTMSEDGTYYYKLVKNVPKSEGNETDEGPDIYVFKVIYVDARGSVTWHPDGMGNNTEVKVEEDGSSIAFVFKLLSGSPTKPNANERVIATVYGPGEDVPEIPEYPTEPTEPSTPEETEVSTPAETEPSTPEETEPSTPVETEPSTPEATDPSETDPSTPEVTDPSETAPSTPEVTYPSTPGATQPSVTEPSSTGKTDETKAPAATVKKTKNPFKAKAASVKKLTVKAKKVKTKKVTLKKAIKVTKNGGAKLTYTLKKSKSKKISVTKKGYVVLKKGLKKGTYTITVKVTAKATKKYSKTSKTVKVKIKVK